jgi:hypothetical protein
MPMTDERRDDEAEDFLSTLTYIEWPAEADEEVEREERSED